MSELIASILLSAGLFIAVIALVRLAGRRWVAGRTGWERVWMTVIAVLAAGMSVQLIPLGKGSLAILTWTSLALIVNYLLLKSKAARDLLEGREVVVIQHGKVMEDNLKEERMTPEDFLRQLRSKQVFQVSDVEFAVMEADGEINVLLKADQRPMTPAAMGHTAAPAAAPQTVILDGNIMDEGLFNLGLSREWLQIELDKIGISAENVVIGQVDPMGDLFVDLFDDALQIPRPTTRALLYAQLEKAEADLMTFSLETKDLEAKKMYEQCVSVIQEIRRDLTPLLPGS